MLKISEQDISKGQPIYGNGTFVIGQDQDTIGGRFSTEDSFRGTISQVSSILFSVCGKNSGLTAEPSENCLVYVIKDTCTMNPEYTTMIDAII